MHYLFLIMIKMSKYIGKYTFNKFVREKILEIGRSLTSESEF